MVEVGGGDRRGSWRQGEGGGVSVVKRTIQSRPENEGLGVGGRRGLIQIRFDYGGVYSSKWSR